MRQNALTIIVPVQPDKVAELEEYLNQQETLATDHPQLRLRDSPSTHFARFVLLDRHQPAPRLLFSSNHDGTFPEYVRELVERIGPALEDVFSKCVDYPVGSAQDPNRWETFAAYLDEHSYASQAFFAAYSGDTVGTVLKSIRVRQTVDELLNRDEAEDWLKKIGNSLNGDAPSATARAAVEAPEAAPPACGAGANDVAVHRLSFLAWLIERLAGVQHGADSPNRRIATQPELSRIEDLMVQNQMTVIVPVKPCLQSRLLLRLVLWAVNKKAQGARGSLAGLTSIHFARWVLMDDGRNLLFESNYDGSWENYIDDFVDYASTGMNAIWANCVDFPLGGCRDIEWFKQYIRENQIPAQVFYSAYPQWTVRNILTDLQVGRAAEQLRDGGVGGFVIGAPGVASPLSPAAPSVSTLDKAKKVLIVGLILFCLWRLLTRRCRASTRIANDEA